VQRYVFDLPYAEVGRALGCSEDAARANAYEGRRKLKELWGSKGGAVGAKRGGSAEPWAKDVAERDGLRRKGG
jgi:hypothetical protein